jgi:hypothetical protein
MSEPDADNDYLCDHVALLLDSYRRWTGRDLANPDLDPPRRAYAIWTAPFVVASHGTGADPVFNYGNQAALRLFDTTWDAFTRMPSRLSAEAMLRAERQRLLERVNTRGYIDDYSGIRVSARGRRFRIRCATVWNVVDVAMHYQGQAVTFSDWESL